MVKSIIDSLLGSVGVAEKSDKARSGFLNLAFRVAVTVGIFAVLFLWLPLDQLAKAISSIPIGIWAFVIGTVLLNHTVSAMKWRLLLSTTGTLVKPMRAVRAHGAGLFATIFLPGNVGGDFVRAAIVARQNKGQLGAIAVGGVGDRVNDMLALVLISFFASLFLPEVEHAALGHFLTFVTLGLAVGIAIGAWTVLKFPLEKVPARIADLLAKLREAVRALISAPLAGAIGLLLSILIQCTFIFLNIVFANAMGLDVPIMLWFFAWPMTKLIALAPVSLGGLGVRNAVLAGLMAPFGIAPSLVVAQSLCWDAVMIATGIAGYAVAAAPMKASVSEPSKSGPPPRNQQS